MPLLWFMALFITVYCSQHDMSVSLLLVLFTVFGMVHLNLGSLEPWEVAIREAEGKVAAQLTNYGVPQNGRLNSLRAHQLQGCWEDVSCM